MSLTIESYYNIPEKQSRLADLYRSLFEKAIFLVPSRMDKEPLLRLISENGSFWGARPIIWTWSEFYRETSSLGNTKARLIIDPPDHTLIIRHILGIYLKEMEEKGIDLPPGIYRRGFVSVLGENIKDLLAEEIPTDLLNEALLSGTAAQNEPEAILYRLYSDYIGYLLANALADNAQIPTLIRGCLYEKNVQSFINRHVFIAVGFLSFTGAQNKLIKTLKDMTDCVMFLPETGLESFYDAIKQLGSDCKRDRPSWKTNIEQLLASNPHLQFESIARELALWSHGKGGLQRLGDISDYGEVGVMVAPRYLSNMEHSLARYEIPFNSQVRGSVKDTLLGMLPKMIWDAFCSGWETKNTSFLLATPLLCGSDFKAINCGSFPTGRDAWASVLRGRALNVFKAMEDLCNKISSGGYPADILRFWRDFLYELEITRHAAQFTGGEASLDGAVKDLASSLSELDKKIDMLEDIKRDIGAAAETLIQKDDAVAYIVNWSDTASLPITLPQSRSVTIYAATPPVLTSHRYWIMTDVDANSWPGKLRESPLMSNEFKHKINADSENAGREDPDAVFHVPDTHDERDQKEALFRRLIATGVDGVIITRSLTDEGGRPTEQSPFTQALFEDSSLERQWVNILPAVEYPLIRSLPDIGDYCFFDVEVSVVDEKINRGDMPKKGVMPENFAMASVVHLSSLDDWISCPYRYWCKNILYLAALPQDLFDPAKAGSFLHALWNAAWGRYLEKKRSFTILIENVWQETIEKEYPELASDMRLKRQREHLKRQAISLAKLQDDIENSTAGRTKVATEFVLSDYEVDGITFKGRCDRVDFYGNGVVVIDYKSNKASQHINELQLAAYSVILKEMHGLETLGYAWMGHKDGQLKGYFASEDIRKAYHAQKSNGSQGRTLDKFLAEAGLAMKKMSEAIKSNVFPSAYHSDRCRICEFYTLCRRREAPFIDVEENSDGVAGENDV